MFPFRSHLFLPSPDYDCIVFIYLYRYLCAFLNEFSQYSDATKMSVGNIAIVIGPNLLWPREENSDPAYVQASSHWFYHREGNSLFSIMATSKPGSSQKV